MQITEVRIKLMENSEDRLRGFCSITFDNSFVVRDLKIIEGNNGLFVAMPSRKLTSHCFKCRTKNHLKARYCNNCGAKQRSSEVARDSDGRARLYADIAHPVNARCREMIQKRIIEEFDAEIERAKDPDYVSRYHDDYDAGPDDYDASPSAVAESGNGNKRFDSPAPEANKGPHQPDKTGDSVETSDEAEQGPSGESFGEGIF